MATIVTDAVLHYDVGEFGEMGYAVPNWSDDVGSNNPTIIDFVNLIGQNLFHLMHHEDCELRTPPSINTLMRIDKLYKRANQLLTGRAIPANVPNMESQHVRPAGEFFRVYPCPYFHVRNTYMRRWAEWGFMAMAEAMQHTENSKSLEISTNFVKLIGQYFTRIYQNMAIELFGKSREEASADGFLLSAADFTSYDPSQYFTLTEMVDTPAHLGFILTEDRIKHLREGIPVVQLPELKPWPLSLQPYYKREVPTPKEAATAADKTVNAAAFGGKPTI
ncbi:MAG: hypothetical protein COA78_24810 [Blastopirellula sp.]|nr:MAG: hypothetical protein COA78_24810 [Blastopirellula sp.]